MSNHAPLLFGKYKLLELVARGGMAEVFKAKSYGVEGFEKLLVIKRILPDLGQNQQFVEMFINEAKLSVALSHANIVQVFDLGREEDTYFIAMEFVHGMDFADALRRCRRAGMKPPTEICVYVASETARALDYAHRRRDTQMRPLNIVHRDISPQNLLLSFEGEVKVTDFGIAKARKTIDETGVIKGKYAYMAPEQARGGDVDARVDLYALGVVLYEALAGQNPFHAPSPHETLRRVQAGEKPPLKLANPDVPDELARIVEKAMAPDRDVRYPTAAKVYEDLAGYLYTTGKRVSGHDLAEWLRVLRGAQTKDDDTHRMRDALEDIEPSSMKTPVEVPTGAASRVGSSTGGTTRPHIERRDVTLVSIEAMSVAGASAPPRFDALLTIATRYGGHVVDQADEHIVLIFGAQAPDGRDTETALRCALKLSQAALRGDRPMDIGIGVHPARVHVTAEGVPERDERLLGALAQVRDVARAAGNRIFASEPVGRLMDEQFHLVPVAGRSAQIERVAGTPLQVLGERGAHEGAHRKFIGRKEQFKRFGEIMASAAKDGSCTVSIVGEAGTGKSRFLEEVQYRLRRMNHPVTWYGTTCLPHERDVPLAAVQGMLRSILGIDETDPEAVVKERTKRLRELGLSLDEMRAVGVLLGTVRQREAISAGTRPLRAAALKIATRLAQDQLTVFVFDSAENMDDESQALVDELVRSTGRARVVTVVACRPGYVYPWSDIEGVQQLVFDPLSEDEARQLVAHRLGLADESTLPPELTDDLSSKSLGNPLFVEEFLKALVDSGAVEARDGAVTYRREIAEVGVPKTLRGLVSSRVARLSPAQRGMLQVASVVGSRFHHDVIAEVGNVRGAALESALQALVERGVILRTGGGEFAFAHELMREVVYEGLTLETRRQLHGVVASTIEQLFADRLDEMAERLAFHHREANERGKAIEYLARAARRQQAEAAYAAATLNFSKAIELLQASPRSDPAHVMALYSELGLAAIRGRALGIGVEKLRLGLAYAEDLGEPIATARMLMLLGRLLTLGSRFVEGIAHLERAHQVAKTTDRALQLEIASAIGEAFARNGEFRRALGYLAEAARLADEGGNRQEASSATLTLARCEAAGGDRDRALATWERAKAMAAGSTTPLLVAETERCLAFVYFQTRDFAAAAEHNERATEIAREFGLSYEIAVNAHNAGDASLRLGDYKRAFAWLRSSLDVCNEHGFEKLAQLNALYLAFIDGAKFASDEGRKDLEASLAYAEENGFTWDVLQAKYLLGVMAKERGERDQARKYFREALGLARDTDNRMYIEDAEGMLAEIQTIPPGMVTVVPPPR